MNINSKIPIKINNYLLSLWVVSSVLFKLNVYKLKGAIV